MNIYVLSDRPAEAARMLCDAHVVTGVEDATAFMVAVHVWFKTLRTDTDVSLIVRHPCCGWLLRSKQNYLWYAEHALHISLEYKHRFGKLNGLHRAIVALQSPPANMTNEPMRPVRFYEHLPRAYRGPDAVEAYRRYYANETARFARWRHTDIPYWMTDYRR